MKKFKYRVGRSRLSLVWLLICFGSITVHAQRQYHVSVSGDDRNSGSSYKPLRSISSAAVKVRPGDRVIVHAGTYREWVSPAVSGLPGKPIVFEAAAGEQVFLKGSEVVSGWTALGNGVWKVVLKDSFFGGHNPFATLISGDWYFPADRKLHTAEVYLNGTALYEADSLAQVMLGKSAGLAFGLDPASVLPATATWFAEVKNGVTTVWARFGAAGPNQALVEVNVRPACFYPKGTGINYITVRGFHISQLASNWAAPTAEQVGAIGTNWSKGWLIENNVVSDSKCAGITLGKDRASGHNPWSANPELDGAVIYNDMVKKVISSGWSKANIGSHIVRGNAVFNCGQAGICGSFGGAFSVIERNRVYDIYTRRGWWGAEMAGIKLHGAVDTRIADNLVYNTNIGIWVDWMAQGTEVSGNVCYGNDYVDFFPEVNHGPYLVADNYFLSPFSVKDWSEGGAYLHNYFGGLMSSAAQERLTPYFKPGGTELVSSVAIKGGDNHFYNNVFYGNLGKPFSPVARAVIPPDGIDKASGYGLGHYLGAAVPVSSGGNIYFEGAKPLDSLEAAVVAAGAPFQLSWKQDGLYLKTDFFSTRPVPVSSALLGKTSVSGQSWSLPSGLGSRTYAGPLKSAGKTGEVRIW